jgi:malonyl CoA-acyl carrier protein transacylase
LVAPGTGGAEPGSAVGGPDLVTGHSAGLLTAWAVARHGSLIDVRDAADVLLVLAVIAEEAAAVHGTATTATPAEAGAAAGAVEDRPTPMVAVAGVTEPVLAGLLPADAGDGPVLGLQNAWDRFVVTGRPAALAAWCRRASEERRLRTEWLPSDAPFHHPSLRPAADRVVARLRDAGIAMDGDLCTPLVDPRDGARLAGGDLTARLLDSACVHPCAGPTRRWPWSAPVSATRTDHRCSSTPDRRPRPCA